MLRTARFLDKNNDEIGDLLKQALAKSEEKFITTIILEHMGGAEGGSGEASAVQCLALEGYDKRCTASRVSLDLDICSFYCVLNHIRMLSAPSLG
eukprot:3735233-Amphidinium_carterae.1